MKELVKKLREHKRGELSRTDINEYVVQCYDAKYTQHRAFKIVRTYLHGIINEREMTKALRQADGAYFGNPRALDEFVQLCCLRA